MRRVLPVGVKNCPRCNHYIPNDENPGEYPGALSRTDNKTEVCSPCGQAESLEEYLGTGLMPQEEWSVKNVTLPREFDRDVREMRSVEILEIVREI